jgi:Ca2+-binding RTX toxin-like protein
LEESKHGHLYREHAGRYGLRPRGAGNDTLTGGPDEDASFFNTPLNAKTNVDTITDFKPGSDLIILSQSNFTAITNADVAGHDFFVRGAPHNANQHIVYHPQSGDLLYDADGNGPAKRWSLPTSDTTCP